MQAEREWIEWIRRAGEKSARHNALRVGIGDDAAVLRPRRGWEMAVTTDLFLEGVHFLRPHDDAATCGRRLAVRSLSDLAAMGAEPVALFVSSAYPDDIDPRWAREFYRGLMQSAGAAGASLGGGDVAAMPGRGMVFDVVGVGQLPAGTALRRAGARPGDRLCVSGRLGEAALGREIAHAGRGARNRVEREALNRHRRPEARVRLGQALRGRASAAIDISDGLSTDLHHLCAESGVGAEVEAARLPCSADAASLGRALSGGEDYEILFTLPARRRVPVGATEIGRITAGRTVTLVNRDGRRGAMPNAGWEHFIGRGAGRGKATPPAFARGGLGAPSPQPPAALV